MSASASRRPRSAPRRSMFFVFSKILGFLGAPSNLIIALGILGVLLVRTPFARAGRWLVIGSLLLLALIGFAPLGNALIIPLEQRFPVWDSARGAPAGIVVLGGAITPDVAMARDGVALNEAAERMTAAVELARRYPDARIIFSGGEGNLLYGGNESEGAVQQFERLRAGRRPGGAAATARHQSEDARL